MGRRDKGSRNRSGVVYSTNSDFNYQYEGGEEEQTLPNDEQDLRVMLDKKQRGGKQVTLVTGFIGTDEDLKGLGKFLKSKCGTGGSAKEGEIIVQGNNVEKVFDLLIKEGYRAKKSGGY